MYSTLSFASVAVLATNLALSSAAFTYNSCQPASAISAAVFVSNANSTFNSVGQCGRLCIGSAYMAVLDQQCLCSAVFTLSASTSATANDCSHPCPGFPADTCGGASGDKLFFSLYANSDVKAPASNSSATATTTSYSAESSATASATGAAGNKTTSATTSAKPTSTPSQLPVSGASAVGAQVVGALMVVGGMLALL